MGGQGPLGRQVVFQVQDVPCGGQGVALAGQLPNPGRKGELVAAVPAPPARCPLRGFRASGIQRAQEHLPQTRGAESEKLPSSLDSFLHCELYKNCIGH